MLFVLYTYISHRDSTVRIPTIFGEPLASEIPQSFSGSVVISLVYY